MMMKVRMAIVLPSINAQIKIRGMQNDINL